MKLQPRLEILAAHVIRGKFESGVHGKQLRVAYHKDITAVLHGKAGSVGT